jgi:hypothetical protein
MFSFAFSFAIPLVQPEVYSRRSINRFLDIFNTKTLLLPQLARCTWPNPIALCLPLPAVDTTGNIPVLPNTASLSLLEAERRKRFEKRGLRGLIHARDVAVPRRVCRSCGSGGGGSRLQRCRRVREGWMSSWIRHGSSKRIECA